MCHRRSHFYMANARIRCSGPAVRHVELKKMNAVTSPNGLLFCHSGPMTHFWIAYPLANIYQAGLGTSGLVNKKIYKHVHSTSSLLHTGGKTAHTDTQQGQPGLLVTSRRYELCPHVECLMNGAHYEALLPHLEKASYIC